MNLDETKRGKDIRLLFKNFSHSRTVFLDTSLDKVVRKGLIAQPLLYRPSKTEINCKKLNVTLGWWQYHSFNLLMGTMTHSLTAVTYELKLFMLTYKSDMHRILCITKY